MDIQQCGAFIARLRKEHGFTQKQLADRLGVTDKAVSRWETGKGLPDASSLLLISEEFSVTVNELLTGERMSPPQIVQSAEQNVVGALRIGEREAKKSLHRGWAIASILLLLITLLFGVAAYDVCCLNGVTPSSLYYTYRANVVADQIEDGKYEQAVSTIGFLNSDRETQEPTWVQRMRSLEYQIEIRKFQVDALKKDDGFISGKAVLLVADRVTQELYMFNVTVAQQDGVVFGGVSCMAGEHERGAQLETWIRDALSTWNPG